MEKVEHIFGYAGATICPIAEAQRDCAIGYTLVRSEQNAGHMASGYARTTGKVGVCMVTSGPGATNLITGIATAYMDSIPMVAITGQVPSHQLGKDIFQEIDITGAVSPCIKHSYLIKDAKDIPRVFKEAFHIASTGRPGPVLIDIPIDIQKQKIEFSYPDSVDIRGYKPSVKGNSLQIKRVIESFAVAKRPIICAGGGVFSAQAQQVLQELVEKTKIPVVTSMMGLGVLPTMHPQNLGMIGAFGTPTANYALSKADLLMVVGARIGDRAIPAPTEVGKRAKIIHIDVDPAEIGKVMPTSIPLVGDVRVVLEQLVGELPHMSSDDWTSELQARRKEELAVFPENRCGKVNPRALMRTLGDKMVDDATLCVDVGQHQIWACQYFTIRSGRFLTPGGLGTMGYSFPASLGVKVAWPEKQTVVVCGDGSFQMSINELSTCQAIGADVKIVMLQNHSLGMVCEIQNRAYGGQFGVQLDCPPDFELLAKAYGIGYGTVKTNEEVPTAIDAMLKYKGTYLLVCDVDADEATKY
jgi:acetolactate synthase-1/2/3 large subunit